MEFVEHPTLQSSMRKREAKSKVEKHLINRTEVARRLGLSPSYVCALLKGEEKNVERMEQIEDLIIEELSAADRLWRKAGIRLDNGAEKRDGGADK